MGHMVKEEWHKYNVAGVRIKTTEYAIKCPDINNHESHGRETAPVLHQYYISITRFKFGHGSFMAHLYRLALAESPDCSYGQDFAE